MALAVENRRALSGRLEVGGDGRQAPHLRRATLRQEAFLRLANRWQQHSCREAAGEPCFDAGIKFCKTCRMRTTIDFPEDLLRRAKAEAALRGRKLRELVREGVTRVLDHPEPADVSQQSSPTNRFSDGCGIVNSGVGDLSSNPKHMEGFGRV